MQYVGGGYPRLSPAMENFIERRQLSLVPSMSWWFVMMGKSPEMNLVRVAAPEPPELLGSRAASGRRVQLELSEWWHRSRLRVSPAHLVQPVRSRCPGLTTA